MNEMTFTEFLKKDLPPIEYLVDKILVKGGITYFYGPPESFKTTLLLHIATKGYYGEKIFEYEVKKPFRTLWIDEEQGEIGIQDKLRKVSKGIGKTNFDKNVIWIFNDINILNKKHIEEMTDVIEKNDISLIVIDSLAKVFMGNERDESEVKYIFTRLKPLIEKGISIVIIAHTRKMQQGQDHRDLEDLSGSRELGAQCVGALLLYQYEPNGYCLNQTKCRYGLKTEPINFETVGNEDTIELRYLGLASDNIEAHKASNKVQPYILGFMESGKEYCGNDIIEECERVKFKRSSVYEGLKKLVESKQVFKPRRDCYLLPD